ncbi:hypothetical protein J7I80_04940 [Bacillus sp. ISL-41]|uniref:hypothetical protein n=1 Tax=Bacillus sp. ISL-41 TaxID=2819127 RepID=UPI001BE9AE6E|nr:hypothetical protein [Bacillus sp. ISL-41]MBT2641561.1 hypothetical protein [Bacillus sp. ISL-41]
MYFLRDIPSDVQHTHSEFQKQTRMKKLMVGSVLASMAAILQAAGGFLPGIGYLISPFATLPILICAMFSLPIGTMSYILTIVMLFILQPGELFVFPFTTGLLALGVGTGFSFFHKRLSVIFAGAVTLFIGIMILLYVLHFPILGPAVSMSFSIMITGGISLFAFLYSVIWVEISLFFFKRIKSFMI